MRIALAAAAALLLGLGACASAPPPDYALRQGQEEGLALLALTQPFPKLHWGIRCLAGPRAGRELEVVTTQPPDPEHVAVSLLPGDPTALVPLVLPEGEYEIFRWSQPPLGYHFKSDRFSFRFRVQPGQVTYAGNLILEMTVVRRFNLRFLDQRERALEAFLARYRNIRREQVAVAPGAFGEARPEPRGGQPTGP